MRSIFSTSGQLRKPPLVRYGLTKNLDMVEYAHTTNTYSADSMCQTPATGKGFWHPGYTYDVLLKNLKSNTRYYYSYGTEDHMSVTANFTTPIPKGDSTPYNFIIYGDMGVAPYPQAYATAKNVRKEIEEKDVRFVFHHGDISYARGYAYIWEQWGMYCLFEFHVSFRRVTIIIIIYCHKMKKQTAHKLNKFCIYI